MQTVVALATAHASGGLPVPLPVADGAVVVATPAGGSGRLVAGAAPLPSLARAPSAELGEYFFAPARITIAVGETVLWRHMGAETHDVTAFDGSFRSASLGPGDTFSHTFTQPGTYRYLCTPHVGDGMMGEVVVH